MLKQPGENLFSGHSIPLPPIFTRSRARDKLKRIFTLTLLPLRRDPHRQARPWRTVVAGEALLAALHWRSGARPLLLAAVLLAVGRLDHGAHPVVAVFVDLDAMRLALEAREAPAELFHRDDQFDHRA